ncbi:uncharacterized protein KGF55_003917 [Candida pseudojiufengensis]|uniref:uncharacterized protein n=1 Tax=Candida pseudojiufengensis TaxID=497109 RepID=UPI002225B362|nr:uncharacterized protein KGF55_003917 [Candida pseudojiufengensis]KAI5961600.1 hypothetical protein KGF55_003917 [Candida pseudojiufengensis]
MSQEDTIKLYWLPYSRAQRIVWLLEELNLNYELIKHKRVQKVRAPKKFENYHPLGKTPILEIIKPDGEKITLAESGWITQYLIENYDKDGKLKPNNVNDNNKINYFIHYSEGTIQPMLVGLLVNHIAESSVPFPVNYLVKKITSAINNGYYGSELTKNLKYLNDIIVEQKKKGSDFIVGDKLSGADIMLSFPFQATFTRDDMKNESSFKKDFPDVFDYYLNLTKLEGWKKAAARVKDYENVIIDGKL